MSAPARPVTELPRTIPVGVARRTMHTVQRVRLHVVFGILLLAFGALVGRLVHVQLVRGDTWRALVAEQGKWVQVKPLRGAILDRQRAGARVLAPRAPRARRRRRTLERAAQGVRVLAIADVARFALTLSDVLDGLPTAYEIRTAVLEASPEAATSPGAGRRWSRCDATSTTPA